MNASLMPIKVRTAGEADKDGGVRIN